MCRGHFDHGNSPAELRGARQGPQVGDALQQRAGGRPAVLGGLADDVGHVGGGLLIHARMSAAQALQAGGGGTFEYWGDGQSTEEASMEVGDQRIEQTGSLRMVLTC